MDTEAVRLSHFREQQHSDGSKAQEPFRRHERGSGLTIHLGCATNCLADSTREMGLSHSSAAQMGQPKPRKGQRGLGMVMHVCNSSTLRG